MPIYTYRCKECRHEFDELVLSASAEKDIVCPQCKTPSIERRMAAFATATSSSGSAPSCARGST